MRPSFCLLSLLLLLITANVAVATGSPDDKVYRYVDPNGVVHYTDKPPSKDAKPVSLPGLQTFKHGASDAKYASLPTKPQFSLAINSPTPDQTYHDTTNSIVISVSILPALVSGYGLIYSVDGAPLNSSPSEQTSYTVSDLDRGTHTLSVALIAPNGEQVAGGSTTVHLLQPALKSGATTPPKSMH